MALSMQELQGIFPVHAAATGAFNLNPNPQTRVAGENNGAVSWEPGPLSAFPRSLTERERAAARI